MAEPEAAVAIVQAARPEDSVLLMRRAEREGDSWSGHWSFPGGRRDDGDLDLLQTALRELEEECGLRLRREQMRAPLPQRIARRRVGPYLLVAPFLFQIDEQLTAVPDLNEAVEAIWVPLSLLNDPARHRLQPVPGVPSNALFPGIELPGAPLWGFTYRLITDWLEFGSGESNEGMSAAASVLDFLARIGLHIESGWTERKARVHGTIPVSQVLAYFCRPEQFLPAVNRLIVDSSRIVITGPAYEEYMIEAQ